MWDLGSFWGEGKSTSVSSYLAVMQEIHVLLVDHDPDDLISTSKLLEMCQYKVTVFELASAAITMVSNGKVKVDLIMANINSPDLHGFKLVQLAVNMDIPIILMSVDDNAFMSMRAIENGAFLYIKKPAAMEMVKCLWQHVARERMRVMRDRDRLMAANYRGIDLLNPANDTPNHMFGIKDYGKNKKSYYRGRSGDDGYDSDVMSQGKVKRKVCTEWTQELHEKFLDAVEQLGEGRCFPKEILELMNVPGLTRMQVASHLQKCRNDNWRSPEERKAASNTNPQSSDTDGSQNKPRRFGSMPRLGRALSFQTSSGGGEGSKARPEPEMANGGDNENMGNGGLNIAIATTYQYQQQYVVPHANNVVPGINSSNPMHTSTDEYFCFQEMDFQNYSGVPHGSAGMGHPQSGPVGFHFEPVYGHDQNLKGPSMENRSQWTSSDTSNFASDESAETRAP